MCGYRRILKASHSLCAYVCIDIRVIAPSPIAEFSGNLQNNWATLHLALKPWFPNVSG